MRTDRLAGRWRPLADRLLGRAFAVAEIACSDRVLAVAFLAAAGVLAAACWLRPTFSPDLKSLHLPLRVGSADAPSPEELLHGPRVVRLDSIGVAYLAALAVAVAVAAYRPRHFARAAGALLVLAVAASAVAALNFPALVELLDHEYEQRHQVINTLADRRLFEDSMANRDNSRVGPWAVLLGTEQRGDPGRGWAHLVYGWWLVLWLAAGVLVAVRRPLLGRVGVLAGCLAVGAALGAAACGPRLRGEAEWSTAVRLEGLGDFDAAEAALARSAAHFPELDRLERAWLLAGKIDHQRGRGTPAARSFRVYQLMREKTRPRAVAYAEDLPWVIHRTPDHREGVMSPPGGFERGLEAGWGSVGLPDRRQPVERWSQPPGAAVRGVRERDSALARHLTTELLASADAGRPAVRHQAARTLADIGLDRYVGGGLELDDGRVPVVRSRNTEAARAAWRAAASVGGPRYDCAFYLGTTASRTGTPGQVEAEFAPLLTGTVERPLQADALSEIGDAYLRAGLFVEARRFFAASFDRYNIPEQFKNYRAQRRLGGL